MYCITRINPKLQLEWIFICVLCYFSFIYICRSSHKQSIVREMLDFRYLKKCLPVIVVVNKVWMGVGYFCFPLALVILVLEYGYSCPEHILEDLYL